MKQLAIDIETFSSYDLKSCGVYRYVEAPDFTVLLFAYSVDHGPVQCIDLARGESLPQEVLSALTDESVTKTAYNAAFERICLSKLLGLSKPMSAKGWQCTMVRAARMGLPLSLGQCAKVLKLAEGKMEEGAALIRYFSKPGKGGKRHMPDDAPERWETFKDYCIRDVEVEQAVLAKVSRFPVIPSEEQLYLVDQEINDRGVLIDRTFVEYAARFDEEYKASLMEEAKRITALENPGSLSQLKRWIEGTTGRKVASLSKANLDDATEAFSRYPQVLRVLDIRRELGKASNAKYKAMLECVCNDGRIHGLLQFYGAARTGRWAGRLVQVQNLPQNHICDIARARNIVSRGDLDEFELNYGNVTQTLSELIRTSFVARDGRTFHVCDFSAIEARVIAWLAGETWALDVFRRGGDLYCATASEMFGVPVEKHGANAHLRQKGKISVLALGYGGGVNALEAMGGARMGLSQEEMKQTVSLWRKANSEIVSLWSSVEKAALKAVSAKMDAPCRGSLYMSYRSGCLLIHLPSERTLCYPRARKEIEYGEEYWHASEKDIIVYEGVNQTTSQWTQMRTYGGKLTENIVQAIARDILGEVLLRAKAAGMEVVFHIHDEAVIEAPPEVSLEMVEELFSRPIEWAPDLPLNGAGYSTPYYLKD